MSFVYPLQLQHIIIGFYGTINTHMPIFRTIIVVLIITEGLQGKSHCCITLFLHAPHDPHSSRDPCNIAHQCNAAGLKMWIHCGMWMKMMGTKASPQIVKLLHSLTHACWVHGDSVGYQTFAPHNALTHSLMNASHRKGEKGSGGRRITPLFFSLCLHLP